MTNEIISLIHSIELNLRPEEQPMLRERLRQAYRDEAEEIRNTVKAGEIFEQEFGGCGVEKESRMVIRDGGIYPLVRLSKCNNTSQKPRNERPSPIWLQSMTLDQFIGPNRELREYAEGIR